MKKLFYLSMALLTTFVAGCGKGSSADSETSSAEDADFGTFMRKGVSAVKQKNAAAAAAAATRALELRPESAEAHLLAGYAACLSKDYARARELFSDVIGEASLSDALRAKGYVGRGIVEFEQNDASSARISFLHAQRLDFKNEAAWYYLGLIYRDIYRFYEAAEEHFGMFAGIAKDQRAQKVTSEIMPELRRMIDNAAASRPGTSGRNAEKAAELIRQAKEMDKGKLNKKQLLELANKYAEARKADPLSDVAALGYAQAMRRADNSLEGVRKTLRAYCDVIALKPGSLNTYLDAAYLVRENEPRYKDEFRMQAVEIMDRAVAHHPRNPKALDQLIAALRKTGSHKLANAWDEYRKVVGQR